MSETNNAIFFKRPSFPLPLDGLQVNHLLFLIGKQKTEIQIIELVEKSLGNDTTKFLKKSKSMTYVVILKDVYGSLQKALL